MADGLQGFENDWLDRRVGFLLDRADAHLAKQDDRSRACAATLFTDAAAIGFMRKDQASAQKHLHEAGSHFLGLGLPHGALLLLLATQGSEGRENLRLMLRGATARGKEGDSIRAEMGPLFTQAVHRPEQLLSLAISAAMAEAGDGYDDPGERQSQDEGLRGLLHTYRSHPVGASGLPVAAFLRLLEFGQGVEAPNLEASGNVQMDAMTLLTRRSRQLASAYEDHHHWRLLLSPAALLDFDLVALFAIWWAHGHSPRAEMPNPGPRQPPMLMLPVDVARGLSPRRERPLEA